MPEKNRYSSSHSFNDGDNRSGMNGAAALLVLFLALIIAGGSCKKKEDPKTVDLDQIESDGSTNDRYLFKNEIEREKWREGRYKKKKF